MAWLYLLNHLIFKSLRSGRIQIITNFTEVRLFGSSYCIWFFFVARASHRWDLNLWSRWSRHALRLNIYSTSIWLDRGCKILRLRFMDQLFSRGSRCNHFLCISLQAAIWFLNWFDNGRLFFANWDAFRLSRSRWSLSLRLGVIIGFRWSNYRLRLYIDPWTDGRLEWNWQSFGPRSAWSITFKPSKSFGRCLTCRIICFTSFSLRWPLRNYLMLLHDASQVSIACRRWA